MTASQEDRFLSRVGQRGQITLPQKLREQLGIKPGQYVEIALAGDHEQRYLKVEQKVPLLLQLAGSVRPVPERPLEWDEIQDRAWQAEAEYLAREGLPDQADEE